MTHDDVLFGYRLRLFTLAEELGSVSEACRQMGIARSTYYVWKRKLERYGLDGLGSASAGRRGCRTRSARTLSFGSSPSPSAIRASARGGSRPSFADRSGAGSRSPSTASGGCCGGST